MDEIEKLHAEADGYHQKLCAEIEYTKALRMDLDTCERLTEEYMALIDRQCAELERTRVTLVRALKEARAELEALRPVARAAVRWREIELAARRLVTGSHKTKWIVALAEIASRADAVDPALRARLLEEK